MFAPLARLILNVKFSIVDSAPVVLEPLRFWTLYLNQSWLAAVLAWLCVWIAVPFLSQRALDAQFAFDGVDADRHVFVVGMDDPLCDLVRFIHRSRAHREFRFAQEVGRTHLQSTLAFRETVSGALFHARVGDKNLEGLEQTNDLFVTMSGPPAWTAPTNYSLLYVDVAMADSTVASRNLICRVWSSIGFANEAWGNTPFFFAESKMAQTPGQSFMCSAFPGNYTESELWKGQQWIMVSFYDPEDANLVVHGISGTAASLITVDSKGFGHIAVPAIGGTVLNMCDPKTPMLPASFNQMASPSLTVTPAFLSKTAAGQRSGSWFRRFRKRRGTRPR